MLHTMHSRAIFLFFSSANRFYIVFISTDLWDIKHHRHWQKAFESINFKWFAYKELKLLSEKQVQDGQTDVHVYGGMDMGIS
jgi:hypothetical protein